MPHPRWMLLGLVTLAVGCSEARRDPVYSFSYGHLSPDAPDVDVAIDGTVVVSGLAPGEITGYMDRRALPRGFTISESLTGQVLVGPVPPASIPSQGEQSVLLVGSVADSSTRLLAYNHVPLDPPPHLLRLLVAHAAPDVRSINMELNGLQQSFQVRFLQAGTTLPVLGGIVRVRIERSEGALKLFGPTAYDLAGGGDYSVILSGRLDDGSLRMTLIEDKSGSFFEPIGQIRFFHGIADLATGLDFLADGSVIDEGVRYARAEKAVALQPGTYALTANRAGTATQILDLGTIQIESGMDLTVAAFGLEGGDPEVQGVFYPDPDAPAEVGTSRFRLLQISPDAGTVDLFLDEEALDSVSIGAVTDYYRVDAGTRRIRLDRAATGETLISTNVVMFQGVDYTLVATGRVVGEPALTLLRLNDDGR